MSESTIRAQIKTVLEGVSNIGNVYDTKRYFNNQADRLTIMKATISTVDQIRAWMISEVSSTERQAVLGISSSSGVEVARKYKIEGWLGLKDSSTSEKTLVALIEAINAAFRTARTLSGNCFYHEGIQVDIVDHVDMTGILCNHCELSLVVYERV